ncbi:hypothetical protein Zmor_005240 [Zophobas morio]|uniref:Uncharacterized protein n=1 Tax=Zophobas morio TaxID=2755281 RepID=A0AA38IXF9_9CUCU|nr:hypothetical protein Zmor_005240 [Zophobas morio]
MLNLLIFLTAPLCITSYDTKEEFFNLREHNYCDLRCYETKTKFKVNVACGCEKVTPRLGLKVLNSTFGFREAILDKLNQFRNKIASGSTDMPAGADMMVLNYDVGLEYSAACILKRAQSAGMDLCTRNKNHEALGNFPVMLMPEDKSWMINNIADAMAFLDQKFVMLLLVANTI